MLQFVLNLRLHVKHQVSECDTVTSLSPIFDIFEFCNSHQNLNEFETLNVSVLSQRALLVVCIF